MSEKAKSATADVQAIKAIKGITVIDESDDNAMIEAKIA